jgi:polar amino acid transport system permease protein
MDYLSSLTVIWESWPMLLHGTAAAVELCFIFLAVGVAVAIPIALMQTYGNTAAKSVAAVFEQTFRGLPALVLLFLFYFGLSDLDISPLVAATLAMGLRSAAYQSQIFRGAIQSIESGQMEAARAIGMSRYKAIRHVVLPQAVRLAIPPWSNEYANVVKDTSYVFVVGIVELMRQGRYIVARSFGNALLVYVVIALIYFVLTHFGTYLLGLLSKRMAIPGHSAGSAAMERI